MAGRVVIVGAGPGDPELITVKGLKALEQADVVIYDRLVPRELLKRVKPGAELIFAGKSRGEPSLTQEEINRLMVEKAEEGKLVVRLKGGDPTVLGRGGEEITALAVADVDFEVVPGVTSAIAAPAVANIPVTYRGLSSSVVIATGQEDPNKPRRHVNFKRIAGSVDTVVVLMGLGRMEEICRELMDGGLPPSTPAAIIKDATTPRQVVIDGNLGNVANLARRAGLSPPVVLVVGRVVSVRRWIETLRRGEKLVLVFRPEETSGKLEALLSGSGHPCINIPAARVIPIVDAAEVKRGLSGGVDYAVFTSQIGVRVLRAALTSKELWEEFTSALKGARVIAIGPRTKAALESVGIRVTDVPERYRTSEIGKMIGSDRAVGARVILFRSAGADKRLEEELLEGGAEVSTIQTHTLEPSGGLTIAASLIKERKVKALVLTSPMIAQFVDQSLRKAGISLAEISGRVAIFSIGPATSRRLRDLGVTRVVEAEEHTSIGLYEKIISALR